MAVTRRTYQCGTCRREFLAGERGLLPEHCPEHRAAAKEERRQARREEVTRRASEVPGLRRELGDMRRSATLLRRKAAQADEYRRQLDAAQTVIARLERKLADKTVRAAPVLERTAQANSPAALDEQHQPGYRVRAVRLRATLGEPGRVSLQRAIRRLAHARGAQGTAEALRDVAALAECWADELDRPNDSGTAARRVRAERRERAEAEARAA